MVRWALTLVATLVLATSAVFLAIGLIGLALSPNLPIYIVSWLLLGVGMGAGCCCRLAAR